MIIFFTVDLFFKIEFRKYINKKLFTISHDRYFIDAVSEWILEINNGEVSYFRGNFSEWARHKRFRTGEETKCHF